MNVKWEKMIKNQYGNFKPVDDFIQTVNWNVVISDISYALNEKIKKLIQKKQSSPRKAQAYFDTAIFNLKNIAKERVDYKHRHSRKDHTLTDHAFCRILELVENIDIMNMKDLALNSLLNSDEFQPIYGKGNQIITIEKKVSIAAQSPERNP